MKTIIYIYLILLVIFPIIDKISDHSQGNSAQAKAQDESNPLIVITNQSCIIDNTREIRLIKDNFFKSSFSKNDIVSHSNLSHSSYLGKIMIFY